MQRLIEQKSKTESIEKTNKLKQDLESFKKYLSNEDLSIASNTALLIDSIALSLNNNESIEETDKKVSKLRTSFEELRSRILMQEWFSDDESQQEGN